MSIRTLGASAALGLVLCAGVSASASVITQYNLVVTGNLVNNSQDVEGSLFVGGNLTGGSPTLAKNLSAAAFAGQDTVVVAGNISVSNINLHAGNLRRGGTRSGNLNFNGIAQQDVVDLTLPAQATAIRNELAALSNTYRAMTATSTAMFPTSQPAAVKYTVSGLGAGGVAVFNVSAASVFNSGLIQQIELNAGAATSIVINVAGTSVNFNTGNMVGNWTSAFARSKVIWNFYEATSIVLDRNFNGALLAPLADLRNSTAIDGSVFVKSFTQSGEVHLPNYAGVVPSPGTMALMGVAGIVAGRRRRA
jgi:choice-of-anchor A domain-containing protein